MFSSFDKLRWRRCEGENKKHLLAGYFFLPPKDGFLYSLSHLHHRNKYLRYDYFMNFDPIDR